MSNNREHAAKRRQRLEEAGLCNACGKQPPILNQKKCFDCAEKARQYIKTSQTRRKKKAKENNLCTNCFKNKKADQRKLCIECIEYTKMRYYNRKQNGLCSYCSNQALPKKTRCEDCSDRLKQDRQQLKLEVFDAYGGAVCCCCNESNIKFLTVDHLNNDGNTHRKLVAGSRLYKWLKAESYPSGYQVLCWNCNIGKAQNGGVCPHKEG